MINKRMPSMHICCSIAKEGGEPTPADPGEHLLVVLLEVGGKVLAPYVLNALVRKDGLPPFHPALAPQLICQVLQRVTWALPVPLRIVFLGFGRPQTQGSAHRQCLLVCIACQGVWSHCCF